MCLRQCQGIIRLAEKYGDQRLNAACQRALDHDDPAYKTIRTILHDGMECLSPPPSHPATRPRAPRRAPTCTAQHNSSILNPFPTQRRTPMVQVHHLQSKLKKLRLGGMLDTLELRLEQADQQRLGYLQFLELMLEDEITRRDQRSLTLRIAQAHFEEIKTLEEFDFTFNVHRHRF
jgi:hypothetical protein